MVGLGGQYAEVGCSVVATPSLASDGHVHLRLSANRKAKPNLVNETRIGGKVGVCVIVMAHHPQASTPLLTTARFDKKKAWNHRHSSVAAEPSPAPANMRAAIQPVPKPDTGYGQ